MRPPALRPPRCATPGHGNRFALSTEITQARLDRRTHHGPIITQVQRPNPQQPLRGVDTGVHYDYALDSLYENDMLEWVPVAPGEQSLYEQTVAAARALAASRARELSHKRKQRGSAPPAAVAVASWRRYR